MFYLERQGVYSKGAFIRGGVWMKEIFNQRITIHNSILIDPWWDQKTTVTPGLSVVMWKKIWSLDRQVDLCYIGQMKSMVYICYLFPYNLWFWVNKKRTHENSKDRQKTISRVWQIIMALVKKRIFSKS